MNEVTNLSGRDNARRLDDRDAIRDLPIRYCHFVRSRDYNGVMSLFSDDATMRMPPEFFDGGLFAGEALKKFMVDSIEKVDPWPFTHNHMINFDGPDSATGVVHAEIRMGNIGYKLTHLCVYEDRYVRRAGEWKFAHRSLSATPVAG